jgi:hypothetical protein
MILLSNDLDTDQIMNGISDPVEILHAVTFA